MQSDQMILRRILSIIFAIACVSGWSYQVVLISSKYFDYQAVTRVIQDIEEKVIVPELSLCFRYTDIFDLQKFHSIHGVWLTRPTKEGDVLTFQSQVTIKDIFMFTPWQFTSLEDCAFSDGKFRQIQRNNTQCYEYFHVIKYYTLQYICYHYKFLGNNSIKTDDDSIYFPYYRLSHSLSAPGVMYSLDLNRTLFEPADTMKIVISQKSFPFRSRAFAPSISRNYNPEWNNASYDLMKISFSLIKIHRIEAPYDTMCINEQDQLMYSGVCNQKCLIGLTTKRLHRIPHSTIITKPVKLKHVNVQDLIDDNFTDQLNEIENLCDKLCNYSSCDEVYSQTYVVKEDVTPKDEFRFIVESPRTPAIIIKYSPRISLSEYILYLSSTIGIWFGISVYRLNPLNIFNYNFNQINCYFKNYFASKSNKINPCTDESRKCCKCLTTDVKQCSLFRPCLFCLETRMMLRNVHIEVMYLREIGKNDLM